MPQLALCPLCLQPVDPRPFHVQGRGSCLYVPLGWREGPLSLLKERPRAGGGLGTVVGHCIGGKGELAAKPAQAALGAHCHITLSLDESPGLITVPLELALVELEYYQVSITDFFHDLCCPSTRAAEARAAPVASSALQALNWRKCITRCWTFW